MQTRMQKALDHALHEFSSIHTGKASPTMVEGVMVDAYGSSMRIKDCAAITTPDARLIQIQPWDKGLTKAIEKAIQQANLGLNPSVDGQVIRVPLPELSRERRQEFVKVVNRMAEADPHKEFLHTVDGASATWEQLKEFLWSGQSYE